MKLQTQTPLTTLWNQPQVFKKKKKIYIYIYIYGLMANKEYLPPDHGMGWCSYIVL